MTQSPAVITAASALAEWARERRRTWTDAPLPAPAPFLMAAAEQDEEIETIEETIPETIERTFPVRKETIRVRLDERIEAALAPMFAQEVASAVAQREMVAPEIVAPEIAAPEIVAPEIVAPEIAASEIAASEIVAPQIFAIEEPVASGPSRFETIAAGLKAAAATLGAMASAALERLEPLGKPATEWLVRGAAIASTLSVLLVVGLNSGRLFASWDRVAAMVIAATNRPPSQPAPVAPPSGTGRLQVESLNGAAQVIVDGTPRGLAPMSIDLPAGAHRVLFRSEKGSVERAVRIAAGEPTEIKEAIFPGWVALTTPIDLSLSEDGHPLKRDERGWAILPPGPHEIHLDNRALGVHEVRRVVVTPGDTTRLSFAPQASTLSLTTNEPADIWIDGTSFGQAPLVDQPITLGVHDVRLRSAAHERWLRVRATVQPVTVNVDLTAN